VFVVDDEADIRESVTVILESCHTVAKTVASAAEALEALGEDYPIVGFCIAEPDHRRFYNWDFICLRIPYGIRTSNQQRLTNQVV